MKMFFAFLLCAASMGACAGEPARLILQNPETFFSGPRTGDTNPKVISIIKDREERVSVLDTGDIMFSVGATINTNILIPRAGNCVGYMIVRFNGMPMLVPVHEFYPGDTPPSQFNRLPYNGMGFTPRDCYPK